jgi:hypothetical protein
MEGEWKERQQRQRTRSCLAAMAAMCFQVGSEAARAILLGITVWRRRTVGDWAAAATCRSNCPASFDAETPKITWQPYTVCRYKKDVRIGGSQIHHSSAQQEDGSSLIYITFKPAIHGLLDSFLPARVRVSSIMVGYACNLLHASQVSHFCGTLEGCQFIRGCRLGMPWHFDKRHAF